MNSQPSTGDDHAFTLKDRSREDLDSTVQGRPHPSSTGRHTPPLSSPKAEGGLAFTRPRTRSLSVTFASELSPKNHYLNSITACPSRGSTSGVPTAPNIFGVRCGSPSSPPVEFISSPLDHADYEKLSLLRGLSNNANNDNMHEGVVVRRREGSDPNCFGDGAELSSTIGGVHAGIRLQRSRSGSRMGGSGGATEDVSTSSPPTRVLRSSSRSRAPSYTIASTRSGALRRTLVNGNKRHISLLTVAWTVRAAVRLLTFMRREESDDEAFGCNFPWEDPKSKAEGLSQEKERRKDASSLDASYGTLRDRGMREYGRKPPKSPDASSGRKPWQGSPAEVPIEGDDVRGNGYDGGESPGDNCSRSGLRSREKLSSRSGRREGSQLDQEAVLSSSRREELRAHRNSRAGLQAAIAAAQKSALPMSVAPPPIVSATTAAALGGHLASNALTSNATRSTLDGLLLFDDHTNRGGALDSRATQSSNGAHTSPRTATNSKLMESPPSSTVVRNPDGLSASMKQTMQTDDGAIGDKDPREAAEGSLVGVASYVNQSQSDSMVETYATQLRIAVAEEEGISAYDDPALELSYCDPDENDFVYKEVKRKRGKRNNGTSPTSDSGKSLHSNVGVYEDDEYETYYPNPEEIDMLPPVLQRHLLRKAELVLSRFVFMFRLRKSIRLRHREVIRPNPDALPPNLFTGSVVFRDWPRPAVERLCALATAEHFGPHYIIHYFKQPRPNIILLIEGSLLVIDKRDPRKKGVNSRRNGTVLTSLKGPCVVNEALLYIDDTFNYCLESGSKVKLISLPPTQVEEIINSALSLEQQTAIFKRCIDLRKERVVRRTTSSVVPWSPLFKHLSPAQLEAVFHVLEVRSFMQGSTILSRRGDDNFVMYWVITGTVEGVGATRSKKDNSWGTKLFATFASGSTIGEKSVYFKEPYLYNLVAKTHCDVLLLRAGALSMLGVMDREMNRLIADGAFEVRGADASVRLLLQSPRNMPPVLSAIRDNIVTDSFVRDLQKLFKFRIVPKGEFIATKGNIIRSVFVIVSGTAHATMSAMDNLVVPLSVAIGVYCLAGAVWKHSVIAQTSCEMWVLSIEAYCKIARDYGVFTPLKDRSTGLLAQYSQCEKDAFEGPTHRYVVDLDESKFKEKSGKNGQGGKTKAGIGGVGNGSTDGYGSSDEEGNGGTVEGNVVDEELERRRRQMLQTKSRVLKPIRKMRKTFEVLTNPSVRPPIPPMTQTEIDKVMRKKTAHYSSSFLSSSPAASVREAPKDSKESGGPVRAAVVVRKGPTCFRSEDGATDRSKSLIRYLMATTATTTTTPSTVSTTIMVTSDRPKQKVLPTSSTSVGDRHYTNNNNGDTQLSSINSNTKKALLLSPLRASLHRSSVGQPSPTLRLGMAEPDSASNRFGGVEVHHSVVVVKKGDRIGTITSGIDKNDGKRFEKDLNNILSPPLPPAPNVDNNSSESVERTVRKRSFVDGLKRGEAEEIVVRSAKAHHIVNQMTGKTQSPMNVQEELHVHATPPRPFSQPVFASHTSTTPQHMHRQNGVDGEGLTSPQRRARTSHGLGGRDNRASGAASLPNVRGAPHQLRSASPPPLSTATILSTSPSSLLSRHGQSTPSYRCGSSSGGNNTMLSSLWAKGSPSPLATVGSLRDRHSSLQIADMFGCESRATQQRKR